MHVPKEQRSKLDDKETLCIFIEYGDEEFGYRLWDSKKQKIVRRRDVVFHEHKTIEDMEKNVSDGKLTYEGIADLTSGQTSSESATNEAEMSGSEPRKKLEKPIIEEEDSGDDSDTGGVGSRGANPFDECKTHLCFEFISHAILSILYPYSCKTNNISFKLGFSRFFMESR